MTVTGSIILAVIAGTLLWKGKLKRSSCCLLLLAGSGIASAVAGVFAGFSLLGVGIFSLAAVIGSIFFWEEVVRKTNAKGVEAFHPKRTPIVSVLTGIAIMGASGSLWAVLQNVVQTSGSQVDQTVNSQLNR